MRLIQTPTCSVKPPSPSLISLESQPLQPDFGFSLGGQTSLWLSGKPVGWILILCGPWCFEIQFGLEVAGHLLAPHKATSIYGQVGSLADSIFFWINQWIALSFCVFVY